jgi:hypothetical protein
MRRGTGSLRRADSPLSRRGLHTRDRFRSTLPRGEEIGAYLRLTARPVPGSRRDEGEFLHRSTAILTYIADLAPEKSECSPSRAPFARAIAQSWLAFLSSTLPRFSLAESSVRAPGCDNREANRPRCKCRGRPSEITELGGAPTAGPSIQPYCDLRSARLRPLAVRAAWPGTSPPLPNLDRVLARTSCAAGDLAHSQRGDCSCARRV